MMNHQHQIFHFLQELPKNQNYLRVKFQQLILTKKCYPCDAQRLNALTLREYCWVIQVTVSAAAELSQYLSTDILVCQKVRQM